MLLAVMTEEYIIHQQQQQQQCHVVGHNMHLKIGREIKKNY